MYHSAAFKIFSGGHVVATSQQIQLNIASLRNTIFFYLRSDPEVFFLQHFIFYALFANNYKRQNPRKKLP